MTMALPETAGLNAEDRKFLERVESGMSLLADLSRADVVLYARGPQPNSAMVVAQAQPHPVSPIFLESLLGRQVGKKSEPTIFQVLQRGRWTRAVHDETSRSAPTVQEVYPVRSPDGSVLGVLNCESNLLEYERMRKKSPVFRNAMARMLQMVLSGRLPGVSALDPLGEHDGLIVIDQKGFVKYISGIAENLYRKLNYTGSLLSVHIDQLEVNDTIVNDTYALGVCIQREVEDRGLIWIKKSIPILSEEGLRNPNGASSTSSSVLLVIQDVTEERLREQALTVKSTMIKEIHHRVKNNLQTIAALLRMQSRRSGNPEVVELLKEAVNRILSVAVVHEFLSHDEESIINIRDVCSRILSEVTQGILDPDKHIRIVLEGENTYLPAQQATSTALVVNELLQNSVKHGYEGRTDGQITIRLELKDDWLTIEIADDGVGIPPDLATRGSGRLGLSIVRTLVEEDLRGKFELLSSSGTTARVSFPRLHGKTKAQT
jgi:two-component sensor histidine kinase